MAPGLCERHRVRCLGSLSILVMAVSAASLVALAPEARSDLSAELLAARHQAMVEYVRGQQQARGCFTLLGFAMRSSAQGQMPWDEIHNYWVLHPIGRARSEGQREEWFYQALCGMLLAERDALSGDARLTGDTAHVLEAVRRFSSLGANLSDPQWVAALNGDPILRDGLRTTVLAYSESTHQAVTLNAAFEGVVAGVALADDARAILMEPLVVSQNGIAVVEAVGASTGDADLAAACRRLGQELETGQTDYLARLKAQAGQGQLVALAAEALAKVGVKAGATYLLGALGMGGAAAAQAGAVAGSVFAAFVAGVEIGLWLTGENAACEHARLAHFADYIRPGLLDRWDRLCVRLDPENEDLCSDFDATSRALILSAAYVQIEAARIKQAYASAPIPSFPKAYTRLQAEPGLGLIAYRRWSSGDVFGEYLRLGTSGEDKAVDLPAGIVFVREGDIYVCGPGASVPQRITTMGRCHSPAWSRDGTRLAFARDLDYTVPSALGDDAAGQVWVCQPDGEAPQLVAGSSRQWPAPGIWGLAWTPEGDAVIVQVVEWATSGGAWRVRLNGSITGEAVNCNGLDPVDRPGVAFAIEKHDYTRGYGAEEIFLADSYLRPQAYATELTDLYPTLSPGLRWAATVQPDDTGKPW
jgi:hypothetical protein